MAKKQTTKPARMPPPIIGRLQNSGMMKFGEMMMQPPAIIAARMQKPTGRKPAGKRCRSK